MSGSAVCTRAGLSMWQIAGTSAIAFLFPLSIGEERILSNSGAYVSLIDHIIFKRLIVDYKFIHVFYFP